MTNKFTKAERLKSKKEIAAVFKSKNTGLVYPVKFLFDTSVVSSGEREPGVKVLITVPKRSFKKAVDRNRIKRLIRESYRTQKHNLVSLAAEKNLAVNIAFVYVAKEVLTFNDVNRAIGKVLHEIERKIAKNPL
jgi:ribonuclease P protein component